jgi:3-hydroxyacyl-CoA dehydrogenase/enoyl-CoA hydratase/3-hydroxybutyryl-CoA epimerase
MGREPGATMEANLRAGNIRTTFDGSGILLATIDMPARTMNVFSSALMDSLEQLLELVESSPHVNGVVISSGKPAFIAGADLEMVLGFSERARADTHEQLHALCGRLSRLFLRLERCGKPFVAALNGLALGGGLELALACHARVAADDKCVQLGLPEVKLGLLPGGGGTQRLPRMVGMELGMKMLLGGDSISAREALEAGLVDEVVPPAELVEGAKRLARTMKSPCAPWDRPGWRFDTAPFDLRRADAAERVAERCGIAADRLAHYPAYRAIVQCVAGGSDKPMEVACQWEMDCFVRLIRDPVAGAMVRTLFVNRQRLSKLRPALPEPADARVAVLGHRAAPVERLLAASRVSLVPAEKLRADDIAVVTPGAPESGGIRVAWLDPETDPPASVVASAWIWVSEATEHGRAAEIVPFDAAGRDAALVIAHRLRATPLISSAPVLPALRAAKARAEREGFFGGDLLLAVALAAARAWGAGLVDVPALVDTAAVIAGVHPAYTGGPFNYLHACGPADVRARAARASARSPELFAVPSRLPEPARDGPGAAA